MKTDQASPPEELPGGLSEEDEDEHEDDPPNPVRYLREVGFQSHQVGGFQFPRLVSFQFPSLVCFYSVILSPNGWVFIFIEVISHQIGGYATVCVPQVEGI